LSRKPDVVFAERSGSDRGLGESVRTRETLEPLRPEWFPSQRSRTLSKSLRPQGKREILIGIFTK